jgi:hypothetical protein
MRENMNICKYILAVLLIAGLSAASVLPSDLIEHKAPGQVLVLSGTDNKIFKEPAMQLKPLGPPHFTDGAFVDYQAVAQAWLNYTPPLTPSI